MPPSRHKRSQGSQFAVGLGVLVFDPSLNTQVASGICCRERKQTFLLTCSRCTFSSSSPLAAQPQLQIPFRSGREARSPSALHFCGRAAGMLGPGLPLVAGPLEESLLLGLAPAAPGPQSCPRAPQAFSLCWWPRRAPCSCPWCRLSVFFSSLFFIFEWKLSEVSWPGINTMQKGMQKGLCRIPGSSVSAVLCEMLCLGAEPSRGSQFLRILLKLFLKREALPTKG